MGRRHAGEPRFAALDLGTNNCRLLIAEPRPGGFEVVDSFSRITRLGEGLARHERLLDGAMSRTLAALKICRRIMERNDVVTARCVATEACRRACNGAAFIERVQRVTGIVLEVLEHEEEARLAMLGCLPLIDEAADELLMVDIGGGSTEVMWLDRRRPLDHDGGERVPVGRSLSLPIGVVTLSETFSPGTYGTNDANSTVGDSGVDHTQAASANGTASGAGEAEAPGCYADMVELVRGLLRQQRERAGSPPSLNGTHVQMLGTSGTVTTLAAVHLGLSRYDRRKVDGICMPFTAIQDVASSLRALNNEARAAHPCIGSGRADLVVAGCAILDAIHETWPVLSLRVADRGVREGILNQLMGRSLRHALASFGESDDAGTGGASGAPAGTG